ncbi:MAG: hypothetical protein HZC50_04220 [Nitrospirae bacterium]|nr:hypothetical protein [Nitrospirota bacterium]
MDRSASRLVCRRVPIRGWAHQAARLKLGLRCQSVRRFTTTTDSTHRPPVADNLLAQMFTVTRPNEMWGTDITSIAMVEGGG